MRTIEVIANPYIALDKDGIPQGVVGAGMPGVFIGARPDLEASKTTGKHRFYFPLGKDGALRKIKVVLSGDILTSVQAGELIVCNLPDALACGLTVKEYLPPGEALAEEKAKALAYYRSVKGPDAELGALPTEATPAPETGAPEIAAKQLTPTLTMKLEG